MPVIFTIGTSDRSAREFLMILKHYGIQAVADVRSFPKSRFEHFNQPLLRQMLIDHRIQYYDLGKELGGYRKGGYQAHMGTPLFARGLERLISLARQWLLCLLCAERLPWRCHRRFIGERLSGSCWEVRHIIDTERLWIPPKGSPGRLDP